MIAIIRNKVFNFDDDETFNAPAKRSSVSELELAISQLKKNQIFKSILNSMNTMVMILNSNRQILMTNNEVIKTLNVTNPGCLVGLRPGEIFDCIHFANGPAGCGTSKKCRTCGAVISIMKSLEESGSIEQECRMTVNHDGRFEAMEFHVKASSMEINGTSIIVFVLQNISAFKKNQALERVFFNDVVKSVDELKTDTEILEATKDQSKTEKIRKIAEKLSIDIENQRIMIEAELGDLVPKIGAVTPAALLKDMEDYFSRHELKANKDLIIECPANASDIVSDHGILSRIIRNMIINALEATAVGNAVVAKYELIDNRPAFKVHNDEPIPSDIADRIFSRSYSTKSSKGRGFGTYMMKLLGESYLHGEIGFTTDEDFGTEFYLKLPLESSVDE